MSSADAVRVLVVDDSPLFREAIANRVLQHSAHFEAVAVASTAAEALEAVERHRPHVITLDLGLPDMDGFEVVRRIMAHHPTPILVLTASLSPPGRKEALFSLSLGAVEVMQKPAAADINDAGWCVRFCDRLRWIARAPVVPHLDYKIEERRQRAERVQNDVHPAHPEVTRVAALVGSVGSLRAINTILGDLKGALPLRVPLLIAMHLGGFMGQSLARFLADDFGVDARVLKPGDRLLPGVVHVAPGGYHVRFEGRAVQLLEEHPGSTYRPDLNLLLGSMAQEFGRGLLGVVLSGMGSDAAVGLAHVRSAGGGTMVQEYASCLVASMPRSAVQAGGAQSESSLAAIAQALGSVGG